VFTSVSDPIGSGFATNLAHPGGNITGFQANGDPALGGKWVELLKEIAPHTLSVALLFNPTTAAPLQYFMPSIQTAAPSFAVEVSAAPVHAKDEIEGVIAAQARDPGGSLVVMPDVFNEPNRELIIALAARYSVPTIYYNRFFSELGGLISYGDVRSEQFRLAAGYIDRILKGEKPADLPVQMPTKFELIINLKTAKALSRATRQQRHGIDLLCSRSNKQAARSNERNHSIDQPRGPFSQSEKSGIAIRTASNGRCCAIVEDDVSAF